MVAAPRHLTELSPGWSHLRHIADNLIDTGVEETRKNDNIGCTVASQIKKNSDLAKLQWSDIDPSN